MLLGHLAAAVVVGAWLVAGERALWTLLALTARPAVEAWRRVTEVLRVGVGARGLRLSAASAWLGPTHCNS